MDPNIHDNPYLPPQQESAPAIAEEAPLKDPRLRGWLAAILIGINCLISFAFAFIPLEWDDRNLPKIANVVALLVAAIAFLFWFHRCAANAMVMDRSSKLSSPGWAVASFLIPFVNWVAPCLVMKDLVNSTFKYRRARGMFVVVLIWWLAFLTRNFVGNWTGMSITVALIWLAAVAIAGITVCYLIARVSSAQAAFRWSDAPEPSRPRMVPLQTTGPGQGPRTLPNAIPAPRTAKIPAKRLTPPPAARQVPAPPPAEEGEA